MAFPDHHVVNGYVFQLPLKHHLKTVNGACVYATGFRILEKGYGSIPIYSWKPCDPAVLIINDRLFFAGSNPIKLTKGQIGAIKLTKGQIGSRVWYFYVYHLAG